MRDAAGGNGRQLNANTPITIGLVVTILTVSGGAIFKAAQVLTEFDYVKASLLELKTGISEMKRTLQSIERKP